METPKTMYESAEAAEKVTVTGWRSKKGHFYGDNEHLARWDGCTHLICECGQEIEKGWTKCKLCRDKLQQQKYEAKEFKEWDGVTPLCLYHTDTYFFDKDSIYEHCEMNDVEIEDLDLVICTPNYAHEVIPDEQYCDYLPEDMSVDDIFPELAEAFEVLNKFIRENKRPLSWCDGKYRTTLKKKADAA